MSAVTFLSSKRFSSCMRQRSFTLIVILSSSQHLVLGYSVSHEQVQFWINSFLSAVLCSSSSLREGFLQYFLRLEDDKSCSKNTNGWAQRPQVLQLIKTNTGKQSWKIQDRWIWIFQHWPEEVVLLLQERIVCTGAVTITRSSVVYTKNNSLSS